MQKEITTEKLYSIWAKDYDSWPSVRGFLAEKALLNDLEHLGKKQILELGCGTGNISIPLAEKGAEVTCVDYSKPMLEVLKMKMSKNLNIKIINENILNFNLKGKFDVIIMNMVMDHIEDLKTVFKKVKSWLKNDGIFYLTDALYFPEIKIPSKQKMAILENKYLVDHFVHPESEIKNLAEENKLKILDSKKIYVDESVKFIFDKKPHKSFEDYKGKHILTIYKISN